MSAATIITIATSICAFAITVVLAVGMVLCGNMREKVYRCFFAMLLCNSVGACCEALAAFLIGRQGSAVASLFHVVDFVSYAMGSLVGISFALYLYEYLSTKLQVPKAPFVLMVAFCAANILLLAVGQFVNLFSWLDEANRYHAQNIVWLTQLLPLLAMATEAVVTCWYIKVLRTRELAAAPAPTLVPSPSPAALLPQTAAPIQQPLAAERAARAAQLLLQAALLPQ